MNVVADLPSDAQPPEPVQQRELCSTTQRYLPNPDPCSVPRRAMTGLMPTARTWSRTCRSRGATRVERVRALSSAGDSRGRSRLHRTG